MTRPASSKLQAGEIHGAELIPYARVKELQADPKLRMELWPSTKRAYLVMNTRPTLNNGAPNPLGDVRVRRALNYAVSKEGIIQISTAGLGTPVRSFLAASVLHFAAPPQPYPYDPAKAKALLKEAGFADGFEVPILTLSGSLDEQNTVVAVQQMWAQVGVRLKIELMDNATRLAHWAANDFQMRFFGATDDVADPTEAGAIAAYYPTGQCRHSGWQDKRSDELFVASEREMDVSKRAAEYKEMQQLLNDAAPYIFLYEAPYPVAFRTNAKGFVQTPIGYNIFEAAWVDAWIPTAAALPASVRRQNRRCAASSASRCGRCGMRPSYPSGRPSASPPGRSRSAGCHPRFRRAAGFSPRHRRQPRPTAPW